MNERILVICDRELRYAEGLGENISAREDLAVKVYVCSCMEKVLELSAEKNIHMLVVDESYPYGDRKQIDSGQVFVLCREKVTDLGDEECEIRKYRCAKEIIREIFETYVDKTKENLMRSIRKEKARMVAVYSPIHRIGKTSFAIEFGKECAKKKSVLYLNFETFSGMLWEDGLNMGDLLYYIKQGNGNLGIRLQAAIRKMECLDYLMPIPNIQDFKDVTEHEWMQLIKQILDNSTYELVILDVSESLQGMWSILELCDRIYMPILEDEGSKCKIIQYEMNLKQLNLEKISRMTQRFIMPPEVAEYAKVRAKEEI